MKNTARSTRLLPLCAVVLALAALAFAGVLAAEEATPAQTPVTAAQEGSCNATSQSSNADLDGPQPTFLQESCCTPSQFYLCEGKCARILGPVGECCPRCVNNQCASYCYNFLTETCDWYLP